MDMEEQTRKLTRGERDYVIRRLAQYGIETSPQLLQAEHFDIPIIISDSEILALIEAGDQLAAAVASNARSQLYIPLANLPTTTEDKPVAWPLRLYSIACTAGFIAALVGLGLALQR